ncbi:MAG: RagB/SusD family nutrient uptake outer membrane protein [Prevotellaceae bacterium]|jgi:hypothetical protein|nr:RagB/SusD family nutrient uptake outer membrane protein [Prevotellaceae bacterium]
MNTLRLIKYYTGIIALCAIPWSCSNDFLELLPISNTNEVNYYQTEKDFETAIVAAYATLYTEFGPESGAGFCSEQMSDEATVYDVMLDAASFQAFKSYSMLPANTVVLQVWQDEYNNLMIVNTVIEKLRASPLGEQLKTSYEAEMRFLRALYHFNLVRLFGDVPLMKKPIVVDDSYGVLRSPESEVYAFIIEDLQFAADNLPLQSQISTRVGQATKGAALGILGKVYLTVGNKSAAKEALKQVIDSREYELLDNYADLWDLKHENSKEALLEIQHKADPAAPASPYHEYFAPYNNLTISPQGHGLNQVTEDLWNEFEQEDLRRESSILTGYTNKAGNWISVKFPKKWWDPAWINTGSYYSENNFIVLRYADVLLMYAEATDDANYLNQVRNRAGMPRYGEAGYPAQYSTLALAIEHERMVELSLEFHRWFDLKRTGRAATVLSAKKGKPITEQMLVLPIPQVERDINPALTQNTIYR